MMVKTKYSRAAAPSFTNRSVMYRLKYIVAELKKGSRTADQMAAALEVSTKTINRDVELLRNLGLNISSKSDFKEQGYAFGYQLDPGVNTCPFCSCKSIRRDAIFLSRTSWMYPPDASEYKAHAGYFINTGKRR